MEYRAVYRERDGREWSGDWFPWQWEDVLVHVKQSRSEQARPIRIEVR